MRRAAAAALVLLASLPALAAPSDLAVTDKAKQPITEFYVSPTTSNDWGDDRLGDADIASGHTQHIRLDGMRDCTVDMRVVYGDASSEERHEVDVCRTKQVTFDASGAGPGAKAHAGEHSVVIVNDTSRPIQLVLIAASQAGDWGDDLLPGGSLSVGDQARITYRGYCLADLRVVYDNGSAEERRDLDLCGLHGVVVRPGWTTVDHLAPLPSQAAKAGP